MVNIHLYGLKKKIGNNTHYFLGQVLTAQIWQKPLKVSKTWLSIKPEKNCREDEKHNYGYKHKKLFFWFTNFMQ